MINLNNKIDLLVQPSDNGTEKKFEKKPEKELEKEGGKVFETEPEANPDDETQKKKYRYKWK